MAANLTEAPPLAAIVDSIHRARFSDARTQLSQACPPAPLEACRVLATVLLWWQIQLDPNSRRMDGSLQKAAADAIDAAERWTRREPSRPEAWFYFAAAHAPLEQWRALRGQRLAAARDARTIKNALDRAVSLDPTLDDAYFGIGLYHYYADVVPSALKFLRWLLLMPGGDRAVGMREMLRARAGGVLLGAEADYQLHWLYLWYEHQPQRALELLEGLDARYPTNPLFLQRIAEVQRDDLGNPTASAASWQALLDRATAGRVEQAGIAEVRARIGLAQLMTSLSQPSRSIELLSPIARMRPSAPYGAEALAQFELGSAYERIGDRARASSAFDAAVSSAPADDVEHVGTRAKAALKRLGTPRK